jgi:hypothetical protein
MTFSSFNQLWGGRTMHRWNLSRRGFLQRSLAALTAAGLPAWYARQIVAAEDKVEKKPAASDRLVMGIVGVGSPASRSLQVVSASEPSVKAVQLTFTKGCDVHGRHREHAEEEMHKRGFKDFVARTKDYRDLIADKSLNCLLVATPDHWHAQVAIEAMKAGKDVYPHRGRVTGGAEDCPGHRPHSPDRLAAAVRIWRHVSPGRRADPCRAGR